MRMIGEEGVELRGVFARVLRVRWLVVVVWIVCFKSGRDRVKLLVLLGGGGRGFGVAFLLHNGWCHTF